MKKMLKVKKSLNAKYKILIAVGVLVSSATITGSFVYKFVFANHIKTLSKDDVINLDWQKVAKEAISFIGKDGSGSIKYNGKNISNQIVPRFTSKNPQQKVLEDKDFKFKVTDSHLHNLSNGDVLYLKFFAINPHKNSLSKELRSNLKLEVNGLKPKPIDLASEFSSFPELLSSYTSSQLYERFHNKKKNSEITLDELKILNEFKFDLESNLKSKYKFLQWNSKDKYLEIKVILTLKDEDIDLEYERNEKILRIRPSNDYAYIQQEINASDNKPIFDYKDYSEEQNPNRWNQSGIKWPPNFSLEKFYGYSLPSKISRNITIDKYSDVTWNQATKILSVKANVVDKNAPKDLKLINNEVEINILLYDDKDIPQTPQDVIAALNDDGKDPNKPAQSNLNYSQLYNLWIRKGSDFKVKAEDFGYHDFPMAKKLQDDYFIVGWDDTEKLLKIRIEVKDTSDTTILTEKTTIHVKGSTNLNPERQKIDDFFFINKIYYTNKTETEINTFFKNTKEGDKVVLDNPNNLILNYHNPSNLTKGIDLEFQYIKWDKEYNFLDLKVKLIDTNAKPNNTPATSAALKKEDDEKLRFSIKIIPRYDFKKDLDKFPNDSNNIFESSLSYSELFDKFNPNDGIEARVKGDFISPGSFGFTTPKLSKNSIRADYQFESWDNGTKELKIKVTLTDSDSPGVTFDQNFKTFTIKGSTNLGKELRNVEDGYTVFSKGTEQDIRAYFSLYNVGQKFDFNNEFPSLKYQEPFLTQGIELNYSFVSYDANRKELKIKAKVTDTHSPSSVDQDTLSNFKVITVQIVPAYNYALIVKRFNETVPKRINSLTGTELYNLFYDENGAAKHKKGDTINPDDFNYHDRILLPKNIHIEYKFNGWDSQKNLLKIDVSLKNNDIPDLVQELGEDFTLEFYGNNDLQDQSEKIKSKISSPLDYKLFLLLPEQEEWINNNVPLNKELQLSKLTKILDIKSYTSEINKLLENSGINDLKKGMEVLLTRTGSKKVNGNLILNFKVRLLDSYMYKDKAPENNIINNFEIKVIPKFNMHFLDTFIYNVGVSKRSSLDPQGIIDLTNIPYIRRSIDKVSGGWNFAPVNKRKEEKIDRFFTWIFAWHEHNNKPGTWLFDQLFKKHNLIDPNSGMVTDVQDYNITVKILGLNNEKTAVKTKLLFELKDSAKTKYAQEMHGNDKMEVWRDVLFKFK